MLQRRHTEKPEDRSSEEQDRNENQEDTTQSETEEQYASPHGEGDYGSERGHATSWQSQQPKTSYRLKVKDGYHFEPDANGTLQEYGPNSTFVTDQNLHERFPEKFELVHEEMR